MNAEMDYTYKDIIDGNDELKCRYENVIKACINDIEEKYFNGNHIYRNYGDKSDYLFRAEIKGLLQLLLKLELEDPFRDKKAKKTGISQNSIDKIKANYELLESFNELEDYEKRVVLSYNNADAVFNFVNTIKMFRESLSHFLAVTVKNYSFFVSDFFLDIIKQLNIWSNKIVDFKDGRLNQKITGKPSININGNTMTAYFNNIGNLRLDIKTGVISAIDKLSETFYDLDEKTKTYRRKNWAEELSEEHEELKKWYGTTSWDYLSENIDFRKASNEFKMDGTI